MIDEGYIKYECHLSPAPPPGEGMIRELNHWRNIFRDLELIGEYPNGIGYGNVSRRDEGNPEQFIISGTKTGALHRLTPEHYTRVIDYDWRENTVTCAGTVRASSETLTHAAIYESDPRIGSVFHVHHPGLWRALLDRAPATAANVAYGTPEMAEELIRICRENYRGTSLVVAMRGHEEGVIAFGTSSAETGNSLLGYYRRLVGDRVRGVPIPD